MECLLKAHWKNKYCLFQGEVQFLTGGDFSPRAVFGRLGVTPRPTVKVRKKETVYFFALSRPLNLFQRAFFSAPGRPSKQKFNFVGGNFYEFIFSNSTLSRTNAQTIPHQDDYINWHLCCNLYPADVFRNANPFYAPVPKGGY